MADLKQLMGRLRERGCDDALLKEVQDALTATAVDEAEGRIIRTNKGALMVRLSPTRWPIGMYAKDWRILLKLVPAIEHALESMDILEENPDKSDRQIKQIQNTRSAEQSVKSGSVQVSRAQRVREGDDEDFERAG